jgi:hypothetical protein
MVMWMDAEGLSSPLLWSCIRVRAKRENGALQSGESSPVLVTRLSVCLAVQGSSTRSMLLLQTHKRLLAVIDGVMVLNCRIIWQRDGNKSPSEHQSSECPQGTS